MFERIQRAQHEIDRTLYTVSYDRLTTRLAICINNHEAFSRKLYFRPYWHSPFVHENQRYTIKINWFVLWRSTLKISDKHQIEELIPVRRRRSKTQLGYALLLILLRLGFTLFDS